MKNTGFILLAALLFFACTSPEKLLVKGKYPRILKKMIRKAEKGKLDAEWLNASKIAYAQMQRSDSIHIQGLIARADRIKDWEQVHALAEEVEARQIEVARALKHYYPGETVSQLPAGDWMELAIININDLRYHYALDLLQEGREGDKRMAKRAFLELEKIEDYQGYLENLNGYRREAFDLATIRVYIPHPEYSGYIQQQMERRNRFLKVYSTYNSVEKPDVVLHTSPVEMRTGFLNERVHEEHYSKRIIKGYRKEEVYNEADSTHEVKKVPIYKTIRATLVTVERYKRGEAEIDIILQKDNYQLLGKETLLAESEFVNHFSFIKGDERAIDENIDLSDEVRIPSDFEMRRLLDDQIELQVEEWLNGVDWYAVLENRGTHT